MTNIIFGRKREGDVKKNGLSTSLVSFTSSWPQFELSVCQKCVIVKQMFRNFRRLLFSGS